MFSVRFMAIFSCLLILVNAVPRNLRKLGGIKSLSGKELDDAEEILSNSLSKLAAGTGPYFTISKIHSATRQVVAGSLYKYQVDLQDQEQNTHECKVSIWSQPWLPDGIKVTFECEDLEKLERNHSAK